MFRRILIPFDDTTCKLRALQVARDLARHTHAEIILAQVEPPSSASPHMLAEAELALTQRTKYLRSQDVHAEYVIEVGHRQTEIEAIARARQVDLILDVPLHRHQMELEWYSRSATQARTEMPAPMLVWPETGTYSELLDDNDAAIVVPLDGTPMAERALPFAIRLAESYGRRLMLVRVISHHPTPPQTAQGVDEQYKSGKYEAYQYLTALRASIAQLSSVPIYVRIGVGNPAEEILRLAKQQHTGALVVCAHSHSRRDRFFLGGVATQLVWHAEGPVLIIPPHIVLGATFPWIPTTIAIAQVPPAY